MFPLRFHQSAAAADFAALGTIEPFAERYVTDQRCEKNEPHEVKQRSAQTDVGRAFAALGRDDAKAAVEIAAAASEGRLARAT